MKYSVASKLKLKSPMLKSLFFGLANQVLSSGLNFLIMLYLLHTLTTEEFGLFGICFAGIFLISGISASLIAVPMSIKVSSDGVTNKEEYIYICINLVGALYLIIFLLASPVFLNVFSFDFPKLSIIGVLLASLFYSFKDILVRLSYLRGTEINLFFCNAVSGLFFVFLFIFFKCAGVGVAAGEALIFYSLSQGVGFLYLLVAERVKIHSFTLSALSGCFMGLWFNGKWNLLSSLAYSIRTQSHNFIASPILGLTGVAQINAARTFLMPIMLMTPPLSQMLVPRLVNANSSSGAGFKKLVRVSVYLILGATIFYCTFLGFAYNYILPLISGGNEFYQNIGVLVIFWAFIAISVAFRNILNTALEVRGEFKNIFSLNMIVALFSVVLCVVLSSFFMAKGALLAVLLSEVALGALLFYSYIKNVMDMEKRR